MVLFSYFIQVYLDQFWHADFKDDPDIYVFPNLKYVGIELWQVIFILWAFFFASLDWNSDKYCKYIQVKSGTLFDNVLICDDPEYAKKMAEETWGKQKDVCSRV